MADETGVTVTNFTGYQTVVSMIKAFCTGTGHANRWIEAEAALGASAVSRGLSSCKVFSSTHSQM